MRRAALIIVTTALLLIAALVDRNTEPLAAQGQRPAGTNFTGQAFRFNKVKEGVYHAIGTGALTVVGNSTVIVNDRDVIVVDDHVSPAAAWVLLEEIKSVAVTQAFAQAEGVPLYRYQLRLRLARALDLLASYDDLSALGMELGFSSHSHFTAAFRQAYGRTPAQFQRSANLR